MIYLPNDIIEIFFNVLNSIDKGSLSIVNVRFNKILYSITTKISLFSSRSNVDNNLDTDILVHIIKRYPKLEVIYFGYGQNYSGEFRVKDTLYLNKFIDYLNNHPLKYVKKIIFQEIVCSIIDNIKIDDIKVMNQRLLTALGHDRLECIKIKSYHNGSVITGKEIQPLLEKYPTIKVFKYDGFQSNSHVELSFDNNIYLNKINLRCWKPNQATIDSIQKCTMLDTLVINASIPMNIHCAFTTANLKRLELPNSRPSSDIVLDDITKWLGNLECLSLDMKYISDEGMIILAKNCPKLKIISGKIEKLTDIGIHHLTKGLDIEIIDLSMAYNITTTGICSIAQNCANLRFLRIIHHKNIDTLAFELLKNCNKLTCMAFGYGGCIHVNDIYNIVQTRPNLKYVDLDTNSNTFGSMKNFYKDFQNVHRIPYTSNANRLRKICT